VVGLCEQHEQDHGSTPEGYFTCETDGRLYIENYTWERYESGGDCLNCVRARVLADHSEWIGTGKASREALDLATIREAKHLLAVGQDTPDNLILLGNAEFDSMDGSGLYGSDGIGEIRTLLAKAARRKRARAILILDAAYQFAVSVGVYIEVSKNG
jgi:rhamnose utilization protein RhaD (predicted bifunctional aldolase and dehydrogenase)